MSPTSAIIFAGFGGLWVVGAILSQRPANPVWCIVPVVIAAALVGRAVLAAKQRPPRAPGERERVNKIAIYASAFEGIAIFVGLNVLNNVGLAEQTFPLIAIIVGVHFLPFARYVPDPRYYLIGITLVLVGIVGAIIPSPALRAGFVGLGSAVVLWTAAIVATRERHATR